VNDVKIDICYAKGKFPPLRVIENMVLRRIFGPRRDEVTGEWRRLHNEEQPNTGWTARNRIPVETRFSAHPDWPWCPPSLL